GASAVIATARPVLDTAALALVERFYAAWTAGQAPPDALRSAQLHLRRTQPDADWAAYRLVGR
ncbi:MAG: CHAT domain-containing protein, partial [Pseudomonadota bacterium]